MLIDGGLGQLNAAVKVFQDPITTSRLPPSPRRDRRAGRERIFVPGRHALKLDFKSPALYFIQRLGTTASLRHRRTSSGRGIAKILPGRYPRRRRETEKALLSHLGRLAPWPWPGRGIWRTWRESTRRPRRESMTGFTATLSLEYAPMPFGGNEIPRSYRSAMSAKVPNILTMMRIAVIPVVCGLVFVPASYAGWISLGVYAYACVTDFFDGYLARALNVRSRLGRMLDPIADKLLVGGIILTLVAVDRLTDWNLVPAAIILF